MKEVVQKLPHIDAMRGLAILMVILVHVSQRVHFEHDFLRLLCSYGQMGVQLFFIASAYTLCNSAVHRGHEAKARRNFYIRRFFRIAPVYYVGIFLYLAVSILTNFAKTRVAFPGDQYTPVNILANGLFLQGLYPAANNIVPGGWSIGVEFEFYLLFPLLFVILSRSVTSLGRGVAWVIGSLLIAVFCMYAVCSMFGVRMHNNSFAYYSLINQISVFMVGMVLFSLTTRGLWPVKTKIANLLCFSALTAASVMLFGSSNGWAFVLVPVLSGLSFTFLFHFLRQDVVLNSAVVRRVGQVSYSMYLFHFVFAHFFALAVPKLAPGFSGIVHLAMMYIGTLATTFVVSLGSERFIERPGISLGKKIIKVLEKMTTPSAGSPVGQAP